MDTWISDQSLRAAHKRMGQVLTCRISLQMSCPTSPGSAKLCPSVFGGRGSDFWPCPSEPCTDSAPWMSPDRTSPLPCSGTRSPERPSEQGLDAGSERSNWTELKRQTVSHQASVQPAGSVGRQTLSPPHLWKI